MKRHLRQPTAWCVVCLLLTSFGCAAKEVRSTRLQASDFDYTVADMAAALAASDLIRGRTPTSESMVIVINKVENLTTDVIPVAEQWMLMARVRGSMPIQSLSQERNIRFVITPERHELIRRSGFDGDLGPALAPTHLLTATFRASPRVVESETRRARGHAERRQDYYYLEYRILDLASRAEVWTHAFEFKREAAGLLVD